MIDFSFRIWGESSIQCKLVIVNGVAIYFGGIFLITWWFLSGHLQKKTIWIWMGTFFVSAGFIWGAIAGYEVGILWVSICLFMLAISTDTYLYGPETLSIMSYVVPIAMGGIGLGGLTAWMLAFMSSAWVVGIGWAKEKKLYAPPFHADNTSFAFKAPTTIVIFFYLAIILNLSHHAL